MNEASFPDPSRLGTEIQTQLDTRSHEFSARHDTAAHVLRLVRRRTEQVRSPALRNRCRAPATMRFAPVSLITCLKHPALARGPGQIIVRVGDLLHLAQGGSSLLEPGQLGQKNMRQ